MGPFTPVVPTVVVSQGVEIVRCCEPRSSYTEHVPLRETKVPPRISNGVLVSFTTRASVDVNKTEWQNRQLYKK